MRSVNRTINWLLTPSVSLYIDVMFLVMSVVLVIFAIWVHPNAIMASAWTFIFCSNLHSLGRRRRKQRAR